MHYTIDADITKALNKYNKIMPSPRFNTLDGNILNLIRSFYESETEFYMSNKQLSDIMIADPSTIQRSIDRLLSVCLISKQVFYSGKKPMRILSYNPVEVQRLLDLK